jgi:hypothetical protein
LEENPVTSIEYDVKNKIIVIQPGGEFMLKKEELYLFHFPEIHNR